MPYRGSCGAASGRRSRLPSSPTPTAGPSAWAREAVEETPACERLASHGSRRRERRGFPSLLARRASTTPRDVRTAAAALSAGAGRRTRTRSRCSWPSRSCSSLRDRASRSARRCTTTRGPAERRPRPHAEPLQLPPTASTRHRHRPSVKKLQLWVASRACRARVPRQTRARERAGLADARPGREVPRRRAEHDSQVVRPGSRARLLHAGRPPALPAAATSTASSSAPGRAATRSRARSS